ncbi:MAG: TraB/GumN family protein, partial [Fluviicola sp.]
VLETMKQPHKMVEKELEVIARENNIPTSGLESIAFQLSIFKDLPDSLLSDMILQTIRTSGDYTETLKLYTAYKNQDVELLYELINEDEQLADKEAVLLSNRNEDWIPKIDAKTKEKKCFFAVGAGHLGGEKGVLNLLRKQGYTVEAITY